MLNSSPLIIIWFQINNRRPGALSLKNAIDAKAVNTLTLILAWLTTPQKERLSWLLMLTIGKDDVDDLTH